MPGTRAPGQLLLRNCRTSLCRSQQQTAASFAAAATKRCLSRRPRPQLPTVVSHSYHCCCGGLSGCKQRPQLTIFHWIKGGAGASSKDRKSSPGHTATAAAPCTSWLLPAVAAGCCHAAAAGCCQDNFPLVVGDAGASSMTGSGSWAAALPPAACGCRCSDCLLLEVSFSAWNEKKTISVERRWLLQSLYDITGVISAVLSKRNRFGWF